MNKIRRINNKTLSNSKSYRLYLLMIFILSHSLISKAKDYALVVSGATHDSEFHDFLTNSSSSSLCLKERGYDVTFFRGSSKEHYKPCHKDEEKKSKNRQPDMNESSCKIKSEYSEVDNIMSQSSIPTDLASETSIQKYFDRLIAEAKKGNHPSLLMILKGHGIIKCKKDQQEIYLNPGDTPKSRGFQRSECGFYIELFENGKPNQVNFEDIEKKIIELDKYGGKVTLDIMSCFSGFIQKTLPPLQNSCIFTSGSAENTTRACIENDPDQSLDYTGITSYLTSRFCHDGTDSGGEFYKKLQEIPYFKSKKCFLKIKNYFQKAQTSSSRFFNPTSMASSYYSAFSIDQTPSEGSLSCDQRSLMTSGLDGAILDPLFIVSKSTSSPLQLDKKIQTSIEAIDKSIQTLKSDTQISLQKKIIKYNKNYNEYLHLLRKQREIKVSLIEAEGQNNTEKIQSLKETQKESGTLGLILIKRYRELATDINEYTKKENPQFFEDCIKKCNSPLRKFKSTSNSDQSNPSSNPNPNPNKNTDQRGSVE